MRDSGSPSYPFSDLDLARKLERAEALSNAKFVEARARVEPGSGATWIEVAGAYAMFDGVDSPCTQTFGLGVFDEVTGTEMEELEAFFQERGAPVFHEVSPLAGLPTVTLLNERGYKPIELSSVMYRPVGPGADADLPRNVKIRVRPIREEERELWARISVRGWSHVPELADFLLQLAPVSTERENSVSLLAELDGEPVAAAAMCLAPGVAVLAPKIQIFKYLNSAIVLDNSPFVRVESLIERSTKIHIPITIAAWSQQLGSIVDATILSTKADFQAFFVVAESTRVSGSGPVRDATGQPVLVLYVIIIRSQNNRF